MLAPFLKKEGLSHKIFYTRSVNGNVYFKYSIPSKKMGIQPRLLHNPVRLIEMWKNVVLGILFSII